MNLKLRLFAKTEKPWWVTCSSSAYTPKFSEFGQKHEKNWGAGPVMALSATLTKIAGNFLP